MSQPQQFEDLREVMSTIEEKLVLAILKQNPGHVYITEDGLRLYFLVTGGTIVFTGPNFAYMSEDEINDWLYKAIHELIWD